MGSRSASRMKRSISWRKRRRRKKPARAASSPFGRNCSATTKITSLDQALASGPFLWGLIVAGLLVGLELAGLLARPEQAIAQLFPGTAKRLMPAVGYVIVVIAAVGVAFLNLTISRRSRILLIAAILIVELAGVAWVCS